MILLNLSIHPFKIHSFAAQLNGGELARFAVAFLITVVKMNKPIVFFIESLGL